MMQFTNLSRQIQAGFSGTPALEDILGMMIMLCDDVRFETGTLVEKCPVNNRERMIDRLYTISYTLNYIYRKHRKEISEFDPSSAEDEIWDALADIEQKCDAVRTQLKQLEGVRQQLNTAEVQLQKDLAAQKAKQAEVAACRQRIADLETELQQLKQSKLPELQKACISLEAEAAACRADCETLSRQEETLKPQAEAAREALQQRKKAVSQLEEELKVLQQDGTDAEALQAKLEAEKTAYSTAIESLAGLRTKLNTLRADNTQLKEELKNTASQLEDAQTDYNATSDQLSQDAKSLKDLRTKVNDNNVNIKTTRDQIAEKEKDHARSKAELEKLDEELGKIAQSFEGLTADIRKRKEQLRNMDPGAIRRDLETEEAGLRQQIDDLNSMQRQIQSIRSQIEVRQPEVDAARLLVEELAGKQASQLKALEDMQQETDRLRKELKLLEDEAFQDRLHRAGNRLALLTQLHARMTKSVQLLDCGWSASLQDGLQEQTALAEHIIQELQDAVSQYARQWQSELNG